MSLRILLLVRELATGTQTYTQNMVRQLTATGAEVMVGYTGSTPVDLACDIVKLDRGLPAAIDRSSLTQVFRFVWVIRGMRSCILKFRPHAILAQGLDENGLFATLSSFVFRVPAVSFVHDLTLAELRHSRKGGIVLFLVYGISYLRQRVNVRRLSAILVGSNFMSESMSSMFGVSPAVTRLGVDDVFRGIAMPQKEGPLEVIFVGNLTWKKRPEVPLRAVAQLPDLDIRLTYVGDGPGRADLVELCNATGLPDRVTILGRVPTKELLLLLSKAHLSVVPSLWEGFGFAAAEALTAGVPVLASDSGGLREIVKPGYNGFLIPIGDSKEWADCIALLCRDRGILAKMAANCKLESNRFDWRETCQETLKVLQQVMRKRGSSLSESAALPTQKNKMPTP